LVLREPGAAAGEQRPGGVTIVAVQLDRPHGDVALVGRLDHGLRMRQQVAEPRGVLGGTALGRGDEPPGLARDAHDRGHAFDARACTAMMQQHEAASEACRLDRAPVRPELADDALVEVGHRAPFPRASLAAASRAGWLRQPTRVTSDAVAPSGAASRSATPRMSACSAALACAGAMSERRAMLTVRASAGSASGAARRAGRSAATMAGTIATPIPRSAKLRAASISAPCTTICGVNPRARNAASAATRSS